MRADIIDYLVRSGWVYQSIEAVKPDLPRWEARLRERGVRTISRLPSGNSTPAEAQAHNELNLLMLQVRPDRGGSLGHDLRNLTHVRRHKS